MATPNGPTRQHGEPRDRALEGRVAVVTGAASGIGRGIATLLATAGATTVCADRDGPGAGATAEQLRAAGNDAHAITVDVTNQGDVHEAVGGVVGTFGRLDVMCNVAGIATSSLVVDTTVDEIDRVLAVNVKGVYFGCQAAARAMLRRGSGSIVNMSSTAIDVPSAALGCYAMSKAAVAQITKTLAVELGGSGVRVNALAPGFVATPLSLGPDASPERTARRAAQAAERTALGRATTIDEVAAVALFLASDASSAMTGQILRVDCGQAMP